MRICEDREVPGFCGASSGAIAIHVAAVPEPGSRATLLARLVALAVARRRRVALESALPLSHELVARIEALRRLGSR